MFDHFDQHSDYILPSPAFKPGGEGMRVLTTGLREEFGRTKTDARVSGSQKPLCDSER